MPNAREAKLKGAAEDAKRAATRQRLVEAAAEVMAEKGFRGASLADIARRAGVTTGAIYSNFANKEDLLLNVLKEMTPRFVPDQSSPGEAPSAQTMAELAVTAGRYADKPEIRALLQLQIELLQLALRDPSIAEMFVREALEPSYDEIRTLLTRQRKDVPPTPVSAPPIEQVAVAFIAMIQGLMQHRLFNPELAPDALFKWAAEVVLNAGLKAPANRPPRKTRSPKPSRTRRSVASKPNK